MEVMSGLEEVKDECKVRELQLENRGWRSCENDYQVRTTTG
jgi:hypothetical protein